MNRNREYEALLQELDSGAPETEGTVRHAIHRRNRKRFLYRPLSGLAAVFAAFIILVNTVPTVAYACGRVPGLRQLAEAVAFSPSLKAAVENQYVQPVELSQEKNGICMKVEYLIVDRKNVNVFYSIRGENSENLSADPEVLDENGERPTSCSYSSGNFGVPNGDLCRMEINFAEDDVPGRLRIIFRVYDNSPSGPEMAAPAEETDLWEKIPEEEYIGSFEFLLEFDPMFAEQGRLVSVGKGVELDGQEIIIESLEIYPSNIRMNIAGSEKNSAWLKDLDFYIETDSGRRFETISNGIRSTGSSDDPGMISYYAESSYFYRADEMKIVITGAKWLDKDREKIKLDLLTGSCEGLPQGVSFDSAERYGRGWELSFKAELQEDMMMYSPFMSKYSDMAGNEYDIDMNAATYGEENENGEVTFFYDQFPLRELEGHEVWLYPAYTEKQTLHKEISIPINRQ